MKQEPVLVVELCPVEARVLELLDLGRPEVARPELLQRLFVLPLDVARVEASEDQGFHGGRDLSERSRRWRRSTS